MKSAFRKALTAPVKERGFGLTPTSDLGSEVAVELERRAAPSSAHGAVVIAAITSCTNTSNPSVMLARRPAGEEGRGARPARASRT